MKKLAVMLAFSVAASPMPSFAAEVPAASVELNADKQVVCRRIAETGSLAKATKVCKTRKDWKVGRENSRREIEQMTGGAPPRAN